jgi:hypothetical protein
MMSQNANRLLAMSCKYRPQVSAVDRLITTVCAEFSVGAAAGCTDQAIGRRCHWLAWDLWPRKLRATGQPALILKDGEHGRPRVA